MKRYFIISLIVGLLIYTPAQAGANITGKVKVKGFKHWKVQDVNPGFLLDGLECLRNILRRVAGNDKPQVQPVRAFVIVINGFQPRNESRNLFEPGRRDFHGDQRTGPDGAWLEDTANAAYRAP